jgi:hypothetical protein
MAESTFYRKEVVVENVIATQINGVQGNIITPSNTVGQVLKITSIDPKAVAFQDESGGGGGGFPLAVTGDSLNAFKVETAGFSNVVNVDTITPQVNITDANLIMSGTESLNKLQIDGSSTNQQLTYSTATSQPLPFPLDCDSLLRIKRTPAVPDTNIAGIVIENSGNKVFFGSDPTTGVFYADKDFGFTCPNGSIQLNVQSSEMPAVAEDISFSLGPGALGDFKFSSKVPIIINVVGDPALLPTTPESLTTKAYVDSVAGGGGSEFQYKSIASTPSSFSGDIFPLLAASGQFGSPNIDLNKTGLTLIIKFSGVLTHTGGNSVQFTLRDRNAPANFGGATFPSVPFNGTDDYSCEIVLTIGDVVPAPLTVPSKISYTFRYNDQKFLILLDIMITLEQMYNLSSLM